MKLNDKPPTPVSWTSRIIFYGVLLALISGLIFGLGSWRLASNTIKCNEEIHTSGNNNSPLENAQAMGSCIEMANSFLENFLIRNTLKVLKGLPNTPATYVGVWDSSRPKCTYKIEFHDNSDYTADPVNCGYNAESLTGSWGVFDNQIVWMQNEGRTWPPDINRIESETPDSFVLIEETGTRTTFTRR